MARLKNVSSGAIVDVPAGKVERLGSGWVAADGASIAEGSSGYPAQKVDDLKVEIDRRNQGRDEASLLSAEGKKADLVAALEADDAVSST